MASRSLGTLTLDLIAKVGGFVQGMDAAERRSEKWRRQVEKDAKAVGAAIAAGTAAGATALTALTVATVRQAEEVSRFAALTGMSTDVFQRYAAGAKAAGIEQDKLADIFKDVSDKIGDFLQTGGGPLADFFENIAPKVGVTAEQFRKLSGPQALELYVSSLEKAGASQNDMTFYMEALANDATLLLPLLKNNAQGFRELGDQAAAAGAIMDERTIRAANELAAATQIAGESLTGMKNQIMRGMLPALSGLADELFDVSTNTTLAEDAGRTFGTILKGLTAAAVGAYAAFQLAGKGLATIATALDGAELEATDFLFTPLAINKIVDNFDKVKRGFEIGADDLRATALEYAEILRGIWSAGSEEEGGDEEFASRVKKRAALLAELRNAAAGAGVVVATTDDKKKQAELWKWTEEAIRRSTAALDEWEADEQAYRDRLKREGERLTQLIDPQAAFDAEFARLDELLDAGAISWDVYAAAVANAQNALDNIGKTDLAAHMQAQAQAISSTASFMAQSLSMTTDMLQTAGKENSKFYKLMFAAQKAAAIPSMVLATEEAATKALTIQPAWLGMAMSGAVKAMGYASVGIAAGQAISGMAHDGIDSIPQTGTWLLEKGERVTTAETSAKLDRTLDQIQRGDVGGRQPVINIIEDASRAGQVQQRQLGEQDVVDIFVAQITNRGRAAQALEQHYQGMTRRGR